MISKSKIRSIHSSLAIEANSLSLFDVESISENKLILGKKDEVQEVKNAIEAYNHINEYNYRNHDEEEKRDDEIIYMAPESILVPSLMKSLFEYISNSDLNIIILSAIFIIILFLFILFQMETEDVLDFG